MIFFLFFSVLAWVFHGWGFELLKFVPQLKNFCAEPDCFGVLGIYRLSFSLAAFHFLLAIIMIGVRTHGDFRVSIQDGWWSLKLIGVAGLVVAAFFIPNGFFQYYGWVALGASGIFILVQLAILVDFAHSWAENWIEKMESSEEGDKRWFVALLSCSLVLFGISLAGSIVMYVFFSKCQTNVAFITINIVLCFIISALSIHPKVQEANPTSGILQAAIISGYTTYLVWSVIMSEPTTYTSSDNQKCNPWSTTSTNATASSVTVIVGALFTILAVVYTTIRMAWTVGKNDLESQPLTAEEKKEEAENHEEPTADEPVSYSFTKFHLVFALGAMYLAMLFSDWQTVWKSTTVTNGTYDHLRVDSGMGAVWVKAISGWLAIGLYGWTLMGPALFPDRDWK